MTMIDGSGANGNVNSAAFIAAVSGQDSTSLCGEPHVEAFVFVFVFSRASGFESLRKNMLRVLPLLTAVM